VLESCLQEGIHLHDGLFQLGSQCLQLLNVELGVVVELSKISADADPSVFIVAPHGRVDLRLEG